MSVEVQRRSSRPSHIERAAVVPYVVLQDESGRLHIHPTQPAYCPQLHLTPHECPISVKTAVPVPTVMGEPGRNCV